MANAAAVVPYGMNEDSIVYVSSDWKELSDLLTNPVVFLGAKGMVNSPLQWRLKPQTTVLLEPYNGNPTRSTRFVGLFNHQGVTAPSSSSSAAGSPSGIADLGERAAQIAAEELPNGAFIAEFALNTRVLVVRYKVPNRFEIPDPDEPAEAIRFKGRYTEPTYIAIEGSACGNVHFDIEKEYGMTDVNRAAGVMDVIENPHRVFSRLGDHIHNTAQLGALDATQPLSLNRSTKTVTPRYAFSHVRPHIVLENLSSFDDPAPCGVCIDGQTYEECSGNPQTCVWYIDGVMYKCYTSPGN